jgi:inositol phosphorylceramide mannosyltransferase catalytic subunit
MSYWEPKKKYISRCAQIRPMKNYEVKIPRIIMQSWRTHDVPAHWKSSPESIKELMPDWQYILMDNEDNRKFVKKHFPDFLPYYDAFPYDIQRADATRYCWLYVHGGIYMDLDFELQHPLDSLFTSDLDFYLVHSGNVAGVTTNSFMASKKGCKFWLEVIEEMKKPAAWYLLSKHFYVLGTTGPNMLSRVAQRTKYVYGKLPGSRLMPASVCNLNIVSCDAYLKPLQGSSWCGADSSVFNFFLCNWRTLVSFTVCILLLILLAYVVYWLGLSNDKFWPPHKCLNVLFRE